MKIKKLKFINLDACEQTTVVHCDANSVEHILAWYGSFWAGDNHRAFLDGSELPLDQNGQLIPKTIDGVLA
jgi:hypothetical protein